MSRTQHPRFCFLAVSLLVWQTVDGAPLAAVDDLVRTVQNNPVIIPVLANDSGVAGAQLAILRVSSPAHGTVIIDTNGPNTNFEAERLLAFAGVQLSNTVTWLGTSTNQYPHSTMTDGTWITGSASEWTSGFFPGSLWYLYQHTGDIQFRQWAQTWTAGIASQQYVTNTDDVGFMILTSFGNGYQLTGDISYRLVLVQAAQSLSNRFNPAVGCLADDRLLTPPSFEVILDTMMNSQLLYAGTALGGDTNLYNEALSHAGKTLLNHLRSDNSTFHRVIYDSTNGTVLSRGTRDGAFDWSTWARGHAWATYGFIEAFKATGDPRFLEGSQRTAYYYLTNAPADLVPYWDFGASGIPYAPRDSSAAAITLSALMELTQLATNALTCADNWQGARHILDSLASTNYLAQGTLSRGILLHGTGNFPTEVDVSLIYGDYYFIEALIRYEEIFRQTTVTYTPDPGFSGTDTFTYQVGDSVGRSDAATVTVVVEPSTPPPFTAQISLSYSTGLPVISFATAAGRSYQVQHLDNLSGSTNWNSLAAFIIGSGYSVSITDTNPSFFRCYRVGALPISK